jgi:hypothetical protein
MRIVVGFERGGGSAAFLGIRRYTVKIELELTKYNVITALSTRRIRAFDSLGIPLPALPGDVSPGDVIWMMEGEADDLVETGVLEQEIVAPEVSGGKKGKKK